MIEITDRAAGVILGIMNQQNLDSQRYCIEFRMQEGRIAFIFNRDVKNAKIINGLKVVEDPFITEDIFVDFVEDEGGRQGIIFTGEKYEC